MGYPDDFVVFGGKALDGRHPSDAVGKLRVDRRRLSPDRGVARLEALLIDERAPHDDRNRDKGEQSYQRRQVEVHGADEDRTGDHLEDFVGSEVEESLELVDVVVEDGHQVSTCPIFEVGHLEALHMAEGLDTHLVLDCLGEVAPAECCEILESRLEAPDDGGEHGECHDLGVRVLDSDGSEPGAFPAHDDVYGHADQHRRSEIDDLVGEGEGR